MPGDHALLSPSGAHRWMVCAPSAKLEEQFPDAGSDYAAEGTLAHAVAELKVRKAFVEPMGPRTFDRKLNKLKATQLHDHGELRDPADYWPEILSNTDTYLDYISKTVLAFDAKPYVAVEQKLSLENYIPGGFGTGDCIIIGAGELHIIDLKYGKGVPVDADHNPQIMCYALGALERYHAFYTIDKVAMSIVQPRLDSISDFTMPAKDLLDWGVFTLRPAAQRAAAGEGDYIPGEHCRFCRARQQCRARANQYTALEDFGGLNAPSKTESGTFPLPPLLSDAEIGDVLTRAKGLAKWVEDLDAYALSACLAGREIPGWKAVEGRSSRAWDDQDAAFTALKAAGIDETILYERKPLTLAAVEKAVGKKTFADAAGDHVTRQPGKPALVEASDKREAITSKPSAEEDFVGAKGS